MILSLQSAPHLFTRPPRFSKEGMSHASAILLNLANQAAVFAGSRR
jgi:hypothetical protein